MRKTLTAMLGLLAIAAAPMLAMSKPARAGDILWNFAYAGSGVSASGVLDTQGAGSGVNGGYAIVGITGQRNGVNITGIEPPSGTNTTGYGFNYDNTLFTGPSPFVDLAGMLFTVSVGNGVNVYYDGGTYYDYQYGGNNSTALGTPVDSFSVTPVSEPSTLAIFGFGALATIFFAKRRHSPRTNKSSERSA